MKKEERKKSGVVSNETINFHIRQKSDSHLYAGTNSATPPDSSHVNEFWFNVFIFIVSEVCQLLCENKNSSRLSLIQIQWESFGHE